MIRIFLIMVMVLAGSQSAMAQSKKTVSKKKPKIEKLDSEVVKASPLEQPLSSRMRNKRQQLEMATEEEIVRKLEEARIKDEERRREQLLSQQLEVAEEEELETVPVPPQTNEITTTVIVNESDDEEKTFYVSLGGGSVSYPMVNNIPNANGAAGAALGLGLGSDFWLEGGFLYSFQEAEIVNLDETRIEDIDHYTASAAAKYTFGMSNHWVNPVVGVSVNYTRREFNGGQNTSNAFDGGLIGGLDLALNRSVKLGFEGRYMFNIDYSRELALSEEDIFSQQIATGESVQNIEENDYFVLLLNAKVLF